MPGLDGLRAVAVIAVIAYHLGFGRASGGMLGVGVFFTLSGYLITDILLEAWATRRLNLGQFWLARARRLLPALFVMLVVVMAWITIADPGRLDSLRGAVVTSALYVNNWWTILQEISYFDRFGPPSPLGHLWSLAIEEQFYIVWPWLLLIGLAIVRERGQDAEKKQRIRIRPRLAVVTLVLAVVSALAMALLYHPGFDNTRIYEGTDTRAFGLLIGAALAMVWPSRRLNKDITRHARRVLDWTGIAGLAVIALLIWQTNQYSAFIYEGGLVLLSIATAVVVAVVAHPASRLGPVLGCAPLRWIGVRSYAIYLWHLPIVALTTPVPNTGVSLPRAALQVGATFGIAALSWHFVEEPVRQGAIGRLWARVRSKEWRAKPKPRWAWALSTVVVIFALAATAGMVGLAPSGPVAPLAVVAADTPAGSTPGLPGDRDVKNVFHVPAPASQGRAYRSRCKSVVHIGDSTSDGLVSSDYLPDPADRIDAQYARIGAATQNMQISGATSIEETINGEPNAYEVAKRLKAGGFNGCWVIALGTNDTADVFVGSTVSLSERIERMMSVIRKDPVLWVNAKSLLANGPYSEANMKSWNMALAEACSSNPNMHIYDWESDVQDRWFIDDGIHFTSPGYKVRARDIANALATAFPKDQHLNPSKCIVG